MFVATVNDIVGNSILLHQRQRQLFKRQERYKWKKCSDTGLPSHVDESFVHVKGLVNNLPEDEKFEEIKLFDFTKTALGDGVHLLMKSVCTKLTSLHDYEKMATVLGNSQTAVHNAARWTTDVEFGRQMLNGVNPVVIKRCTELPSNFPVTNEMVNGSLNRGISFLEEMKVSM